MPNLLTMVSMYIDWDKPSNLLDLPTDSSARGAVERYARRDRSKRDGPGQTGSARSRSVRDGRRGTSQSCAGQRDRADHPSCEGRLGRRRIVRGDADKPQLPGMVQSRQGGTCCPGRCNRLGVEGECGRTGVALVGRGSADEARVGFARSDTGIEYRYLLR